MVVNVRYFLDPLLCYWLSWFLCKIFVCGHCRDGYPIRITDGPPTIKIPSACTKPSDYRNMAEAPVRILSLDGGGVRGISSLYILKELMAQIARDHRAENPAAPDLSPRPCEYFDLICGTSTGGLIALMLGRLRMVCKIFLLPLTHSLLTTPFSNTEPFRKGCSQASRTIPKRRSITKSLNKKSKTLWLQLRQVVKVHPSN